MHASIRKLFVFLFGAVVFGAVGSPGVVVAQEGEEDQERVIMATSSEEEEMVACYHGLRSVLDVIFFRSSPSPLGKVADECNKIIRQGGRVDHVDRENAVQQGLASIKVLNQHRGRFFTCYKNLLGLPEGVNNYNGLLAHEERNSDAEVSELENACIRNFCDLAWRKGPEEILEEREWLERTIQSEQRISSLQARIDDASCLEDLMQYEQALDVSHVQGAVDRAVQQRVDELRVSAIADLPSDGYVAQGTFYTSLGVGTLAFVGLGLVAYRYIRRNLASREDVDNLRERVGALGEDAEEVARIRRNVVMLMERMRRSDAARARERRLQGAGTANNQ